MTHRENGNTTEAELIKRLGELPQRVEPQNDPWQKIVGRIAKHESRRANAAAPWLRLAAAVVLAFSFGIFLGQSWQFSATATSPDMRTAQLNGGFNQMPNLSGSLMGAEREYQAAFSEFITIGQSVTVLKPATLDGIERNWQEMLDAESALTAALVQYPNNPWLNKRMLELRERQLAMLRQLAGVDRTSRRMKI